MPLRTEGAWEALKLGPEASGLLDSMVDPDPEAPDLLDRGVRLDLDAPGLLGKRADRDPDAPEPLGKGTELDADTWPLENGVKVVPDAPRLLGKGAKPDEPEKLGSGAVPADARLEEIPDASREELLSAKLEKGAVPLDAVALIETLDPLPTKVLESNVEGLDKGNGGEDAGFPIEPELGP